MQKAWLGSRGTLQWNHWIVIYRVCGAGFRVNIELKSRRMSSELASLYSDRSLLFSSASNVASLSKSMSSRFSSYSSVVKCGVGLASVAALEKLKSPKSLCLPDVCPTWKSAS